MAHDEVPPGWTAGFRRRRTPTWTVRDLSAVIAGTRGAGSLVVRYQPVVSAADATPLAVEALVRWQLPDGSQVPPDQFVGTAESRGLGGALDAVVLQRALHQVRRWDAAGIHVHRVAVNLGRTSVLAPDLLDVVAAACANAGVGADRLVLEVLEHERLDLDVAALDGLQALADAGTTIAVDDFGSGYAGLGLLARLPVGVVKLDRGLLPGPHRVVASGAPSACALLAGTVALARTVGAEVTAEGVETPEQWALVNELGVSHVQGWLFAPALDPDDVTHFWRSHSAPAAAPVLLREGAARDPGSA